MYTLVGFVCKYIAGKKFKSTWEYGVCLSKLFGVLWPQTFFLGFFTNELAFRDLLTAQCGNFLFTWKYRVEAEGFPTSLRNVLPADVPVAVETGCANTALTVHLLLRA